MPKFMMLLHQSQHSLQQFLILTSINIMGNTGYNNQPTLLLWVKMCLTGPDPSLDQILQITYVYSDFKLNFIQQGLHLVLKCAQERLNKIQKSQLKYNENNNSFLKQTGLYEESINSKIGVTEAQQIILKDFQARNINRGQLLIAGNQIHHAKFVLMREMPKMHDYLHFRIFQLGSVELLVGGLVGREASQYNLQIHKKQAQKVRKRVIKQVWEDIKQMQFFYNYAFHE